MRPIAIPTMSQMLLEPSEPLATTAENVESVGMSRHITRWDIMAT
jgi:hypothetical protein